MITLPCQPQQNMQQIIDTIGLVYGGGTLNLNPTGDGIFLPDSDITLYSNVTINGNGATIDFGGQPFGVKIIGTSLNNIINCCLINIIVQNTTGTGIEVSYVSNKSVNLLDQVIVQNCGVGVTIDNSFGTYIEGTIQNNVINCQISNTSGFEIHYSSFYNASGGDGLTLINSVSSTIIDAGFENNSGNGISLTGCNDIDIYSYDMSSNTGDGITLISGNSAIVFGGGSQYSNGGWGINIVDSTNNVNIFSGDTTGSNTSGAIQDNGTGTLKSVTVNNFA